MKFEDLAGQEFVVATLKNAIQTGKIAHAYLFSGPRGCGKTSSARILAKALNCANGPTAEPCGTCPACTEITRGASLDVIEIDGASNTSVNDIRKIKDEILFPPNSLRYKIYIIDEVHMLSTSAFNALLKTIEEPPPYVFFIFATTELHKVPATIKSRCQQFTFRLVSPEKIKDLLAEAASETGIQADDEALYWIARESTGSIRDAYTLYDQVAAFSGEHITFEKIKDKLGITGVDSLNAIAEHCVAGDANACLNTLDEILSQGVSIEQFIVNFTDYLRSLLLIQSGIKKESLLGQSSSRFSSNVLASWDAIKLERALSIFLQLFRDIRYSLSPRFELELAISRLTWLSQYVSPKDVHEAIQKTSHLLGASDVNMASAQSPMQNNASANYLQGGYERPFDLCSTNASTSTAQNTFTNDASYNTNFTEANAFEQMRKNIAMHSKSQVDSLGSFGAPQTNYAQDNFALQNVQSAQTPYAQNNFAMQNSFSAPQQNYAQDALQSFDPKAYAPQTAPVESAVPAQVVAPVQTAPAPQVPAPQSIPSAPVASAPTPQIDANSTGALKDELIQRTQAEKTMLGTALSQVINWALSPSALTLTVDKPFVKNQIATETPYLTNLLAELMGVNLSLNVELVEQQVAKQDELPSQIAMLCTLFKGEVVG